MRGKPLVVLVAMTFLLLSYNTGALFWLYYSNKPIHTPTVLPIPTPVERPKYEAVISSQDINVRIPFFADGLLTTEIFADSADYLHGHPLKMYNVKIREYTGSTLRRYTVADIAVIHTLDRRDISLSGNVKVTTIEGEVDVRGLQ